MNFPCFATPRRSLTVSHACRQLFVAGVVSALLLTCAPAQATGVKFTGWREYHFGMSGKEFAAVHPAECAAPPPLNPAQTTLPAGDKDRVVLHLPAILANPTICENTVAIRELGGFQYRVQGSFADDRLEALTIRVEALDAVANDTRRRLDLVRLMISNAAERYGAPDLIQLEINGPTIADWRFDDGASLRIAQTEFKSMPGLIVIQSAKVNRQSDFQ